MLVYRSTVAAATAVAALLVGCADPNSPTDLRKDGPPNVTVVTVMSDLENAADPSPAGLGRIIETATYCRASDEKRPGIVALPDIRAIQLCPDDLKLPAENQGVAEAAPPTWWVRIVFDRLLDSHIEDLVTQASGVMNGTFRGPNNTQPVVLQCNGLDVPYDGYYVPNGNRASWPLGPALYVQPLTAISVPTGASCTVSIKDRVVSKSKQQVPTDQRSYQFKLAPMAFRFSNPDPGDSKDGSLLQDVKAPVEFFFSAALATKGPTVVDDDAGTATTATNLDTNQVKIFEGPNLNVGATKPDGDADPAVCNAGGAPVDPTTVQSYVLLSSDPGDAAVDATTKALIMRLDVQGGATPLGTNWKPNTTYRIEVTSSAKVSPAQGGDDGAIPSDYKLCFHTSAAPM